jgi:hypothetical protein
MTSIDEGNQQAVEPEQHVGIAARITDVQDNIELPDVPKDTVPRPQSTVDVEAQITNKTTLQEDDELYSVFSKPQRFFIVFMTVLGAIISPISGAI